MREDTFKELVWQMLESAQLSGSEVDGLLVKGLDIDYWRCREPFLGLETTDSNNLNEVDPLDSAELASLADRLSTEGYFYAHPVLPSSLIQRMLGCVERLRAENWPLVFAFVYDEFWTVVRTNSLGRVVSSFLGSQYSQNSVIWTYYVAARKGAAGWTPHADGGGDDRLTVWIPLTDATLDNGCMYVIPRTLVPRSLPADYLQWETVRRLELGRLLQSGRALPAEAGSMLGWDHRLIHWGSTSQGSTMPRVSFAVEFVGAQASPADHERPLFDPASLPTFTQRLYMIGKAILEYKKFEPLMVRYSDFAQRLVAACPDHAP